MRRSSPYLGSLTRAAIGAAVLLVTMLPASAEDGATAGPTGDNTPDPWAALRVLDFHNTPASHAILAAAEAPPITDTAPVDTQTPASAPTEGAKAAADRNSSQTALSDAGPARRIVNRPAGESRSAGPSATPRAETSWFRTLGSLVGVVFLILLLGWGYRIVSGGGRLAVARGRQPELLQVIARTAVSARQSLCLVRVGPRLVLIGVGPERLTALDVIADAGTTAEVAGRAARSSATSHSADFECVLEREATSYTAPDVAGEPVTAEETQVSAIKRTLEAAAARLRTATASR